METAFVGAPLSARTSFFAATPATTAVRQPRRGNATVPVRMGANLKEVRDRMGTVKNTQKITDAMRLVAAAKVRRAQDAVLRTRPFSEVLQKVLGNLIDRLGAEFTDLPLLKPRVAQKVLLVVVTGDRGLCGGYNNYIIKKTEARVKELAEAGVAVELVTIGNKGSVYFKRRDTPIRRSFPCGQAPTAKEASDISEQLLAEFLSADVDRVELIYTRFVSLISSEASVRTLLPLEPQGLESEGDEIFQLTSQDGKFTVEKKTIEAPEEVPFPADMLFEQDPLQILNAILPLYLNGQILRSLQESVASELAARMSAMSSATDNAKELGKNLALTYNRGRQAAITQELSEICAGSMATS